MPQLKEQTTYQYIVDLRDQELAKATTAEDKLNILTHFCTLQDAIYERDWASLNTAA
ncbi:hypothetical protein VCRA2110O318_80078 [Vibrio crassostreae]|nr:hypothetical protein VCRA2110O318_80078 [Vibrio crassostreae]CAK2434666.1 hypothetical protein VCRA2110O319_10150 [Vibrio crassostreae]CAK3035489.1 hypothetical protein VCRA217O317_80148 [Vibrio crassostreae]